MALGVFQDMKARVYTVAEEQPAVNPPQEESPRASGHLRLSDGQEQREVIPLGKQESSDTEERAMEVAQRASGSLQFAVHEENDSPQGRLVEPLAQSPLPEVSLPAPVAEPRKTTPLHEAVSMPIKGGGWKNEYLKVSNWRKIEQLVQSDNVNALDEKGNTPLHLVAELPHWSIYHSELVRMFLDKRARVDLLNDRGRSVLHTLMFYGDCTDETVFMLVQAGAAVNGVDRDGKTPLHLLCTNFHRDFDCEMPRLIKALVKEGALITALDFEGNTPLHIAIYSRCRMETLGLLLDLGAPVNAANHAGDTPLHLLVGLHQIRYEYKEAVELFLEKGADKNRKNHQGEFPLHKAYDRKVSAVFELLEPDQPEIDEQGRTPLHLAAGDLFWSSEIERSLGRLRKALVKSAQPMAVDNQGKTPLHYAATVGFYEAIGELPLNSEAVNALDQDGNTPLYYSVLALLGELHKHKDRGLLRLRTLAQVLSNPHMRLEIDERFATLFSTRLEQMINALLDAGADPHIRNKEGKTAISCC